MTHQPLTIVGVLALQGDFAEHCAVLFGLDFDCREVRSVGDLTGCGALILPGGESTVIRKLLSASGLDEEISQRVRGGMPVYGTCAGAIILSDSHLSLMDITVERNAYGSQAQSFCAQVSVDGIGPVRAEFIRAPRIVRIGKEVDVLARYEGNPVLVRQGTMLASTFHTETLGAGEIHRLFLQ